MAITTELKVALVRQPPPNWPMPLGRQDWDGIKIDIRHTVDAGIALIKQARRSGADLVAFPELWFPGFPKWRESNDWASTHLPSYIDNSLVIGGEEWQRLVGAIASERVWAMLAFSEREGDHIYMAQALISPDGVIVHHRRKLRPSGSERDIFSDGTMEQIKVVETGIGRVGMLQCGEHWFPSCTFASAAQRPRLHIGCYPFARDPENTTDSVWYNANTVVRGTSLYALLSGAYVLMPAVGYTFILDPMMRTIAEIREDVSFEDHPILYHSLPAAALHTVEPHVFDAHVSEHILQQLIDSFPKSAPTRNNDFVPFRSVSTKWMKAGNLEWSETGPGAARNQAIVAIPVDR